MRLQNLSWDSSIWLIARSLAVMGLLFGLLLIPYHSVRKPIWGLTTRMLDGETFERVPMLKIRRSMDNIIASGPVCDVDVLAARAVFDMRFAEELLRDSRGPEFDAIQEDVRRNIIELFKCAPRRSFFWMVLFWFENTVNGFDASRLPLLLMSYKLAPHEAWIAVRRSVIAFPVYQFMEKSDQAKVITEFAGLVDNHFYVEAATIWMTLPDIIRSDLAPALNTLPVKDQKGFARAVRRLGGIIVLQDAPAAEPRPW